MELTELEFNLLRNLIHKLCGIVVSDEKHYLIMQRLEPIAMEEKCCSFSELIQKIESPTAYTLHKKIISAITTNESSFFRDSHPFTTFSDHLCPALKNTLFKKKTAGRTDYRIRIWSAASSLGQEPYSIAMLLAEFIDSPKGAGLSKNDFTITATDISNECICFAKKAKYTELQLAKGIPPRILQKYFTREKESWLLDDAIKHMVVFQELNLTKPFTILGGFDLIFCRNVLIYFDQQTKQQIFEQFHKMLEHDGYLVIGATENTYGLSSKFESTRLGGSLMYRKR